NRADDAAVSRRTDLRARRDTLQRRDPRPARLREPSCQDAAGRARRMAISIAVHCRAAPAAFASNILRRAWTYPYTFWRGLPDRADRVHRPDGVGDLGIRQALFAA